MTHRFGFIGGVFLGVLVLFCPMTYAEGLTVASYDLVRSKDINATDAEYTYRAQITNSGGALRDVTAAVATSDPQITIVEGMLRFRDVPPATTVSSIDTFIIRHSRTHPFSQNVLVWNFISQPAVLLTAEFSALPTTGSAPLQMTFIPKPITDTAIETFEWDLEGDGTFEIKDAVGRNQVFTFTRPGDYQTTLRVTDSKGRTHTRSTTVRVLNASPIVNAEPNYSNGEVPLDVYFQVDARDNEGVAEYEWDFEGDGTFDFKSSTSGSTQHTYTTVGNFRPVLRVVDTLGQSALYAVPATEVRAGPAGSPWVRAYTNNNPRGKAPYTVRFEMNGGDPSGRPRTKWEWDFEDDGTFDFDATHVRPTFTYAKAGTYYARLRVTTDDNRSAEDVVQITVEPGVVTLGVPSDTIDADLAEKATITTSLEAHTKVSIVIEGHDGAVVKTLLPATERVSGSYNDLWDGTNDNGIMVPEGVYYAILLHEVDGVMQRFDLRSTTGGSQSSPPRSPLPPNFSPFGGKPLTVDFSLPRASEVTAYIGLYDAGTRLTTFFQRELLGKGSHRVMWNGEDGEGKLAGLAQGDSFLFGIFAYTLPDNAIFVRSAVQVAALTVTPSIFDPSVIDINGQREQSKSTFSLSKTASVEFSVFDVTTGSIVTKQQFAQFPAGTATIAWDGTAPDGVHVAPGRYRLGVTAIDAHGNKSLTIYALQRVFY